MWLAGFSARGLPLVAASDENSYDDALRAWRALSPAAQNIVGQAFVHATPHTHTRTRTQAPTAARSTL